MVKESFSAISELRVLRANIDERIRELREKNGVDTFEESFDDAVSELRRLVDDRCENEDIRTLWQMHYEINAILSRITNKLSGLGDE